MYKEQKQKQDFRFPQVSQTMKTSNEHLPSYIYFLIEIEKQDEECFLWKFFDNSWQIINEFSLTLIACVYKTSARVLDFLAMGEGRRPCFTCKSSIG